MGAGKGSELLIQTKFHRPPLSRDHLHRRRLLDRLDRGGARPLTLVSAPAGYGKSTLISCWLETVDTPHCWYSVDDGDNDLRLFLLYLLGAIGTIAKEGCPHTTALLKSAQPPPLSVLHRTFINEIDGIKAPFILVIDDYHLICTAEIHAFLAELLKHPPVALRLVILGRRDPPLPLVTLRASGQLTEVRTRDLRFSPEESAVFLKRLTGRPVDRSLTTRLEAQTEGWAAGLRLAALSLMHRADAQSPPTDLPAENRYVQDYILEAILARQDPAMQQCLLKISILNRFCGPLCEAVCRPEAAAGGDAPVSTDFLDRLDESVIFLIALDDDRRWFRYHHLIRSVFKRQLHKRLPAEQITLLHQRASRWLADHGLVEEALALSLEIDDYQSAAELVAAHRLGLINREQWYRLDHWLKRFPADFIRRTPHLLLSQAWVYHRQARYSLLFELVRLLSRADEESVFGSALPAMLAGEVAALQSFYHYTTAQPREAEATARRALQLLPPEIGSIGGMALIILALSLQMQGALSTSRQLIYQQLRQAEDSSPIHKTMLLAGLCFSCWTEGDLDGLKPLADQLLRHGLSHSLPESEAVGRYFFGILHYQRNQLDQAEELLRPVTVTPTGGQLAVPSIVTYCQCCFALALVCQAGGREREAEEVVAALIGYMLETGNVDLLETCQAFQAELNLRQGRIEQAARWAERQSPQPFIPAYRFYAPHLARPRILVFQASVESLQEAAGLLAEMEAYYARIHNHSLLIHIQALYALLGVIQGEEDTARRQLSAALALARPSRQLRPFLDLGVEMHSLLSQRARQVPDDQFTAEILRAFEEEKAGLCRFKFQGAGAPSPSPVRRPLAEPLTNREIEVLKILAEGGSNSDIANRLFISPLTVKRHLATIYRKLEVKSRHQAIISGRSMGIC